MTLGELKNKLNSIGKDGSLDSLHVKVFVLDGDHPVDIVNVGEEQYELEEWIVAIDIDN